MKSLWMLCVLAAGMALGTGCGPEKEYCPNIGHNGVCPILGDEAGPPPDMDGGMTTICPPGKTVVPNPDGNILDPLCK